MNKRYIFEWSRSSLLILAIPLVLSAFTHGWNVTGFPAIYIDEDIYIMKALRALDGVLEADRGNPLYGWLVLSFVFGTTGFPDSLHVTPEGGINSIEMLYLVPRAFIGILGVVDTFIIYKIAERYYNNRKIALVGSILFAVMPMTWVTRYVLLEPIQLPFVLSSILFAVYTVKSKNSTSDTVIGKIPLVLLSGIFLGLSIFIKFPTFAMVPLIGFIIYKNVIYKNSKNAKILGLWFLPIILLPLIAPIYANSMGMFNIWWDGIAYQANRGNQPLFDLAGQHNATKILFGIDPILMALGIIGLINAVIKRDMLPLLWIIPYVIFYYALGYVAFQHFMPLFPAFCIAAAKLILDLGDKIKDKNKMIGQVLVFSTMSCIGIFGFACTFMLIVTNINSTQFESTAVLAKLSDTKSSKTDESLTLIMGNSHYYWPLRYPFDKDFNFTTFGSYKSPDNERGKVVMAVDPSNFGFWQKIEVDKKHLEDMLKTYNDSQIVLVLNRSLDPYTGKGYPYTSMTVDHLDIGRIEIRANSEGALLFPDHIVH